MQQQLTPTLRAGATGLLKCAGALALASAALTAQAGQECPDVGKGPGPEVAASALHSTVATKTVLDQTGDEVVLLARMGQDLSEYGLTYSHLGYAVKKDDGTWVVVHKLNDCGTAKAGIFEQDLMQFFMDDLHKYQAGVWRLSPVIQARLKPQLLGKGSLAFHSEDYNMVAYPFGLKYQNSNGWVLEVLSSAIDPSVKNREQAVSWLRKNAFTPSTMKVNAFKRLGARATKANITFEDHPSDQRWAGRIQVVTVDAVANFMQSVGGLCAQPGCPEITVPGK